MIKKTILLLLVLTMVFTMAMPMYTFGISKDFEKHWAKNTIQSWLDDGYVTGYSDGSFKPEGLVTRAEFVKMINNLFGYTETADISFTDVSQNNWYYKEIQKAFKAGYISGVSKTQFAPNSKLTREQAAVIISKIARFNRKSSATEMFTDRNKISSWAKDYVGTAVEAQIVKGYDDKSFRPQNPIKRAEAIVTLDRTINKIESDSVINDITNGKTIKILTIGNSFSQDSTQFIYDIAHSAGVNVIIGNLYFSGCSLETHWSNASNNSASYTYYKWTTSTMTTTLNQTMKACILDEEWDFITFQQVSGKSGLYDTFQPYLNNLVNYVKKTATNANVKLALNMTWAYANDSTNEGFVNYGRNQITMYNAIIDAYQQAMEETDIDIIIPCGTAIQNGRTNTYLCEVGDELTHDGYHLNEGIGKYIAGLTFFEALIVKERNIKKDLFIDATYIPDTHDSNAKLAYLAKTAVKNAVKNPFKITEIQN